MKKTILIIAAIAAVLIISSCHNASKKEFTIKGEVENGVDVDTVSIYKDMFTMEPFASAVVKDGKFTITGSVDTLKMAIIGSMKTGIFNYFVLDNENYTCEVSPGMIKVRGGKIHEIVYGPLFEGEGEKLTNEYLQMMEKARSIDKNDKVAMDKMNDELKTLSEKFSRLYENHFSDVIEGKNPAEAKIIALSLNSDMAKYPNEKRKALIVEYGKELGDNHPLIREYKQGLEATESQAQLSESVSNGKTYKPVVAEDRNGKNISLEEAIAKNKYTLLEFWASWCGPCRAEIPNLKKAYEKYKSKGFEIYSVSLDEKIADWTGALDKEKTTWINVVDSKGFNSEISKSYGVTGIPSSFLISKEGIIVGSGDELRGEDLEKLLENLLK